MIKLLIFVKSLDGGTGTFVFSLQKIDKFLKNDSIQVKTLALEKPRYRDTGNKKRLVFFRNANFFPQKYYFSIKNIFNFIQELFWFNEQLNEFKPDIILSVDTHCNLLSMLYKLLMFKRPKTILTIHINPKKTFEEKASPFLYHLLKIMILLLYERADLLVCVSKNLGKALVSDFGLKKRPYIIYNGVPLPTARPTLTKDKNKEQTIITVGRLVKQKDFFTVLKSFSLLNKELPTARLWIVGDGPLKSELLKLARILHIKDKMVFFGWSHNVDSLMKKASVFLLSSHREGLTYAILEAMSQGLPVISTDSPYGPSEILNNNKYGLLIPIGDKIAMKEALLTLLTNKIKNKYYAKKSYERSLFFSEKKMLNQYAKIFTHLFTNNNTLIKYEKN